MITKQEAKRELAIRELSRRKLSYFTKYTKSDYEMSATLAGKGIHQQIIEKLEAVERGEIKRLMIFVRPRMGKSELVSKRFPAWCLGKNPKRNVIVSSYGYDLAADFGRKTKQIVESQEFKNVFPDFQLSSDKKEGGNWETKEGGGYYSVGVGGALTGKGGDILIIDDPVKNREEAESEVMQSKIVDWYTSTFYTRAQSQNSAIIVMMTRWNINDLAGYLEREANNGGDKWEILSIPSIDENGNSIIWPGKWDEGYMEKERANVSAKDWAALYQQDPIASSSNIFNMSNLKYFLLSDFERADGLLKKEDLRCGIFVDPAFSSSGNSDDAVVLGFGKHKISGNYYQLDGYADTSAPSKTFAAILSMYDRMTTDGYKVDFISIEDVSINKDQSKFLLDFKNYLKENNRYIIVNPYHPVGKKEDRIKFILEPKVSLSSLYFRRDMPDRSFTMKVEKQFTDFPNGKHDDVIDCIAQACFVLDGKRDVNPAQEPKKAYFNRLTGKMEIIGR